MFILKIAIFLCSIGFHEESLIILKSFPNSDKIGKLEYFQYHTYKACNEYILGKREDCLKSCALVTETFNKEDCPRRYMVLCEKMEDSVKEWKSGDLTEIEREMKDVAIRLNTAKGGKLTQTKQEAILSKLDKQIKELEDKLAQNGNGDGNSEKDGGANSKIRPDRHADESKIMGGEGKGLIDHKKLKNVAENWGTMPAMERSKVIAEMSKDLPKKYQVMIEDYFKALNRK